jgi:tripartite-type tricarboxylate transporter receptor subunit TctC
MSRSMLLAVLPVALIAAGNAAAQSYPVRPIRMIVAQSAGSSQDTLARIVTHKLSELLGQQVVVDNRGGAAGLLGVELAARATPDGYTLVVGASTAMVIARFTYRKLPFDSLRDFDPVSLTSNSESVMVVNPAVPAKSVKELIALAKAQPGKLNMASAGIGSSSHLGGVMFTAMAGIESVHVPYKGGGPLVTAVVAGESQWAMPPAASVMVQVKAGRLRALAISSKVRSPLLPELPTLDESGVPGYEYTSWNAIFAPRGTPPAVIAKLHATIRNALADTEVKTLYAAQGLLPAASASPAELGAFVRADFERVGRLVKIAGIKPE